MPVAPGVELGDDGVDLSSAPFDLEPPAHRADFSSGPRTGVSGLGGGVDYPWRFWVPGEASVSPYRRHAAKRAG